MSTKYSIQYISFNRIGKKILSSLTALCLNIPSESVLEDVRPSRGDLEYCITVYWILPELY